MTMHEGLWFVKVGLYGVLMTHEPSWPAALARNVGEQVRRLRNREGSKMSAQAFADALTEFGLPYTRAQVTNLEAHARTTEGSKAPRIRRATITVGELIAFAAVLRVPPLNLLFPVGREPSTELLPGRNLDTYEASMWFAGQGPRAQHLAASEGWTALDGDDEEAWREGGYELNAFRRQASAVTAWRTIKNSIALHQRDADLARDDDEQALIERRITYAMTDLQNMEDAIGSLRGELRANGLDPGPLEPSLKHIDDMDRAWGR